jgi:NitT/TauT family transport system ATP-binding protein
MSIAPSAPDPGRGPNVMPPAPNMSGSSSAAPAISLRSLGKSYHGRAGKVHALRDVTCDIGHGEFVSVVGPSGCGKSTILKMIAGIIPRTTGRIEIAGQLVTGPSSQVGVVFQSPVLLPWRTVYENVMLPVDVARQPRSTAHDRALDFLKLAGLSDFSQRYPFELSGGMQQRAAICRALINDPAILLMDEPFGALDAMTREHMNLELQRIWTERRKTVLLITHSIPEAVFLSDRVIIMTSRPGTIDEVVDIDLPRPRALDMMSDETFGRYARHIRAKFAGMALYD